MGTMSVVTVPLKTRPFQDDIINKRLELCRKVYNNMLHDKLKDLRKMEHDKDYKASLEMIHSYYKCDDKNEAAKIKKSEEYKKALEMQKSKMNEYGFSEFGFTGIVLDYIRPFNTNITGTVAIYSIAKPMWAAFEKYFYSNGSMVHFKKANSLNSVASDGKAGLKLMEEGKGTRSPKSFNDLFVRYGSNRGGKVIDLPLMINKKDLWLQEMLLSNIKVVRLVRRKIKGKYRFYVQLTVDRAPAIKFDRDTGEIKNPINEGNVGIYIDTRKITIYSKEGLKQIELIDKSQLLYEEEIANLNRFLDTSRRISNPENFNEDGTIKKGIVVDGQKQRLTWNNSNNYYKALNKKADIQRRLAEQRKIRSGEIANLILSLGNNIVVNNYNFKAAQERKKETVISEKTGKPLSKKKAGKAISYSAPATLLTMVDNKLVAKGYDKMRRVEVDKDMKISDENRILMVQKLYESLVI